METEINNVMDVIKLQPSTKVQCADFAQKVISEVESGNVNALDLAVRMSAMTKTFEVIRAAVNDAILYEARKYGEKKFTAHSAEITLAPVYTKYDYENCNDPVLKKLQDEMVAKETELKARQEFLKNIPKSLNRVDDDGVGHIVYPPLKIQTDGIKISLK